MFRHPHYLDVPWDIHWQDGSAQSHRRRWWLMALVVLSAMFLVGVGVTSGLF